MEYELIEDDEQDQYDPAPFMSYARRRSQEFAQRDPIVGDIVHWWTGERCLAAIVLDMNLAYECVRVLTPASADQDMHCVHSEGKAEGTWHWPCGGH